MGRTFDNRGTTVTAVIVAGAVVGAALGVSLRPGPVPLATAGSVVERMATLEVHIAGWVTRPGVVTVSEGAIIADAVEAAGGLKPGARSDLVNLAAPLRAGDQIVVPGPESVAGPNIEEGPLSVNRADAASLQGLPGVGPVLAERIVAFREANGPFGVVEDLLQVPGIGEAKLASIRDLVRVP